MSWSAKWIIICSLLREISSEQHINKKSSHQITAVIIFFQRSSSKRTWLENGRRQSSSSYSPTGQAGSQPVVREPGAEEDEKIKPIWALIFLVWFSTTSFFPPPWQYVLEASHRCQVQRLHGSGGGSAGWPSEQCGSSPVQRAAAEITNRDTRPGTGPRCVGDAAGITRSRSKRRDQIPPMKVSSFSGLQENRGSFKTLFVFHFTITILYVLNFLHLTIA